ncbi:MAG: SurA N-terminal domain-containing protein [Nitrospirae bacterium]|nr:SurA N-terminal domain-containing protein [Nitrospirota bacterium]
MIRKLLVVPVAAMMLFSACAQKKEEVAKTNAVAVVNGKEITPGELDIMLSEQVDRHATEDAAKLDQTKLKKAVVEQLINDKLLLEGAVEKNLNVTDAELTDQVKRLKAAYKDEAAFQDYLKRKNVTEAQYSELVKEKMRIAKFRASLSDPSGVTDEELKKFYKESPTPMMSPDRVKLRMVQTGDEAEIKKIADAIKSKGFDKVAAELSKDTTRKIVVTKPDWVQPDTFSKATADIIKAAKAGDIVGPMKGMGGFFLFRIEAKEGSRPESFDEAKEKVKAMVLMQKREGQEHMWLEKKKQAAKIVRNI